MDTLQCFDSTCCSIEAVVSVDERGQIVLPKELRDKFGDKFVIASLQRDASLCCIAFIKADALNSIVAEQIAPLFK